MGTGGTLPTNITQTVTLYNTTGVIEKDKGIYFCPFLSTQIGTGHTVRQGWIDAFKQALNYQSNSGYSNINISQWNPKDRSLVIKGNSDDFRVITEEGNCFNYLIVERSVTENSTTKLHYYAFFITNVAQAGQGSVRLELQPDDFTNVFYLHNTKERITYSGNYVDVFNERLKNCYVARQHYNRVYRETSTFSFAMLTTGYRVVDNESTRVTYDITSQMTDPDVSVDNVKIDTYKVFVDGVEKTSNVSNIWIDKRATWYVNVLLDYVLTGNHTISINATLTQNTNVLKEDNLPIFSQIEEGFKYKRQFRDYKEFINYGDPLTAEEKQAYENAESWSDLTDALKIKALKLSTMFAHVVLNTQKLFYRRGAGGVSEDRINFPFYDKVTLPNTKVKNGLFSCAIPIYNKLSIFEKFSDDISVLFDNIELKLNYNNILYDTTGIKIGTFSKLNDFISEVSAYTQYVVSVFITKESNLFTKMSFSASSISVNLDVYGELGVNEDAGNYDPYANFVVLYDILYQQYSQYQEERISEIIDRYINFTSTIENNEIKLTGLNVKAGATIRDVTDISFIMFIEDFNKVNFNLTLEDSVEKNPKEEYFDTVLTFNPYSFYSVSYLGRIEVVLNKSNYYENNTIKCELTINLSDVNKYSFIPTYEISGKEIKYYSESIEQTLANNVSIISSRLNEYIVANQTQMKNQYAVNDLNNSYGVLSSVFSGMSNIAGGYGKGVIFESKEISKVGGLTGGIESANSLIQSIIDWGKDTKQITMNQKAKLADIGNLPSNLKQVGTDINIDLSINELGLYLNHYTIDEVSYNSICKYLERFGYMVNIYDTLNVNTRKGWDYVQLVSFDYDDKITTEQEDSIRQILQNGVTLLHDHNVMVSGHNYEIILD